MKTSHFVLCRVVVLSLKVNACLEPYREVFVSSSSQRALCQMFHYISQIWGYMIITVTYSFFTAKSKSSEERKNSATDDNGTSKTTPTKERKPSGKKKDGGRGGKGDAGPPPESMQPPPGPLVALGRPKDRTLKRPRSVPSWERVTWWHSRLRTFVVPCQHFVCLFVCVCGVTLCEVVWERGRVCHDHEKSSAWCNLVIHEVEIEQLLQTSSNLTLNNYGEEENWLISISTLWNYFIIYLSAIIFMLSCDLEAPQLNPHQWFTLL